MTTEALIAKLVAELPPELRITPPEVRAYSDELVIVLWLTEPSDPDDIAAAHEQIAVAREASRGLRMALADRLQAELGLPVAWGMRAGRVEQIFTSRTVPVMTRLGRAERDVLDTLVAAGVADTRSSALAYAVRAFALEHSEWLAEVRTAIAEVERVRERLYLRPRKGAPNLE